LCYSLYEGGPVLEAALTSRRVRVAFDGTHTPYCWTSAKGLSPPIQSPATLPHTIGRALIQEDRRPTLGTTLVWVPTS
jgi:hypothetical protein